MNQRKEKAKKKWCTLNFARIINNNILNKHSQAQMKTLEEENCSFLLFVE